MTNQNSEQMPDIINVGGGPDRGGWWLVNDGPVVPHKYARVPKVITGLSEALGRRTKHCINEAQRIADDKLILRAARAYLKLTGVK
jgi:hypothetical protein